MCLNISYKMCKFIQMECVVKKINAATTKLSQNCPFFKANK